MESKNTKLKILSYRYPPEKSEKIGTCYTETLIKSKVKKPTTKFSLRDETY